MTGGAVYERRSLGEGPGGGRRPVPYREATEEAERRAYLEYSRDCAGRRMLESLERTSRSPAERVARFERRVRGIPRLFAMKRRGDEKLAELEKRRSRHEITPERFEFERAHIEHDLRDQIEAEFPKGYVLRSEEEELADARCALSRARWEAVRRARSPIVPLGRR